jgi:hypothetical protein
MAATTSLMSDVEGANLEENEDGIKNEFAYHNNVHGNICQILPPPKIKKSHYFDVF